MSSAKMLSALALLPGVMSSWPSELASFPRHPGRTLQVLTGDWDFAFDDSYDVSARTDLAFSFNETQTVPGAWDAASGTGRQYMRGVGAYRLRVSVPSGQSSALHFGACSMFCRVYVDGLLLANHSTGGYSPFWVYLPSAAQATRELTVVSSNVFSEHLAPTHNEKYDFYQYGGLIREVSLHFLPSDVHLANVEVVPKADAGGRPSGAVDVSVRLASTDGAAAVPGSRVTLRQTWDSRGNSSARHVVLSDGTIRMFNVTVPAARIWNPSPEAPRPLPLHTLKIELLADGAAVDGLEVRFGLRTVGKRGRHILLNGEPIKLKGANRHELFPNQGPVLTEEQLRADVDIIRKTLNGNFVRGSHYQQDDRFLDLCDEEGLLIWSEVLGWQNTAQQMADERFMRAQFEMVKAMLDTNMNHPSIILWGFFNEGESNDTTTAPSYEAMASAFRSGDQSRLITWADNKHEDSLNLRFADVVSFNDYPGWYQGDQTTVKSTWQEHAAWVAEHFPEAPFIISEAGADGPVGNHSSSQPPGRGSLEYESLVDEITAQTALECGNIAGISLWQYADTKVDEKAPHLRPGGINNKGLVDQWRNLKPAAEAVGGIFGTQLSFLI